MSRVLILLLFLLWMAWSPEQSNPPPDIREGLFVFLGFYVLLVASMAAWSRLMIHRLAWENLHRSLRRFNRMMGVARLLIPAWFAFGLYALGWGDWVIRVLSPLHRPWLELPALILGTSPAFAAWMGLWWSQFPADRALREQSVLAALEDDLPVHAPPGFGRYFLNNLRLQVLFTLVPVLLILLLRDLLLWGLRPWAGGMPAELIGSVGAALTVFVGAPLVLRRVLDTRPLADSTLRRRLEELCRSHRLGYRDILLWRTQGLMGNAAVMGLLGRVRYVLLSDVLLETMTDEQIEAVFAHELGHIVHRHLWWYGLFVLAASLAFSGPGAWVERAVRRLPLSSFAAELILLALGVATFALALGWLSRRFERQADWFAARTSHGAVVFASALRRVAAINNIPTRHREWLHGSIEGRIEHVLHLADNPAAAGHFERRQRWLTLGLLLVTLALGIWCAF